MFDKIKMVDGRFFCVLTVGYADVAELADAPDLESGAEWRMGSSPFVRTIFLVCVLLRSLRLRKLLNKNVSGRFFRKLSVFLCQNQEDSLPTKISKLS